VKRRIFGQGELTRNYVGGNRDFKFQRIAKLMNLEEKITDEKKVDA